jgi:predicted nuclease of predicted toxin-antitoxin system
MRFLLDESADIRLHEYLTALGHDVTAIAPDYHAGLPDPDVLAIAHRERRVLITSDRDFGELVFRQHLPHTGVILYRLGAVDFGTKTACLDRLLAQHANELDRFFVITRRSIRVRRGQQLLD